MAPLPPSNTPRFKVLYTTSFRQHAMEFRSHVSPSALGVIADDFFSAIGNAATATVIDEVQFAADGSDIFNSVTTGIEGNTYGTGAGELATTAWYFGWVGRSADGRRVRIYRFGAASLGVDYRFGRLESTALDAATDVLIAAGSDLVTIGDLVPVWKLYVNAGSNAHWQKAVRP
jgi:hypothetical protein